MHSLHHVRVRVHARVCVCVCVCVCMHNITHEEGAAAVAAFALAPSFEEAVAVVADDAAGVGYGLEEGSVEGLLVREERIEEAAAADFKRNER